MNIEEFYNSIKGDYKIIMNRFANNERLLGNFLKKFISDQTLNSLENAIKNNEYELIERESHTLSGLASNFGFDGLNEKSMKLVQYMRDLEENTEDIKKIFADIKEEYNKIIEKIKEIE